MGRFDLFADALWQFFVAGYADLRTERDDGLITPEDVSWYFTTFAEYPLHEKRALKFARGRVLDIGSGAGRHTLYLQKQKLRVTAIDISPDLVSLAQAVGVKNARVADIGSTLPFRDGEFDTVILFGNNLGICGTPKKFQKMLRELYRVTSPRGRILATTRQPNLIDPVHRRYWQHNLNAGRAMGQVRLRLILNGKRGNWFDLLLFSPTELMQISAKEKWELAQVYPLESFEEGYAVMMEKVNRS
ncbi:MAG: class I SAM-dependent methyltransferase [Chloroflexi bacterium]|nr:class I SAM-dependent methyltransferase [Chloroflexota bacterium]